MVNKRDIYKTVYAEYGKPAKEVLKDVPDVMFDDKGKELKSARFPDFIEGTVPKSILVRENSQWYNNAKHELCIALPATKELFEEFEKAGRVKSYPSIVCVFKKGRKYLQWVRCDRNLHFYREGGKVRCEERLDKGSFKNFLKDLETS